MVAHASVVSKASRIKSCSYPETEDSWVNVMGSLLCQQSIEIRHVAIIHLLAVPTHTAAIVIDTMKLVAKPTDYLQRQTPVITTGIVMYH